MWFPRLLRFVEDREREELWGEMCGLWGSALGSQMEGRKSREKEKPGRTKKGYSLLWMVVTLRADGLSCCDVFPTGMREINYGICYRSCGFERGGGRRMQKEREGELRQGSGVLWFAGDGQGGFGQQTCSGRPVLLDCGCFRVHRVKN